MKLLFQICLILVSSYGLVACAEEEPTSASETAPKDAPETEAAAAIDTLPEISIGEDSAPVTVIQYTAFSCGHCAEFHAEVLPLIEKKYVEPGHVKIIFRDYPVDNPSLRAAQLAWCGGPLRYLDMVQLLFSSQHRWLFAEEPVEELKLIAASKGISAEQFDACIQDGELMDKIIQIRQEGQTNYEISATPTLIINGKIIPYAMTFEEFEEAIRPLLGEGIVENKT